MDFRLRKQTLLERAKHVEEEVSHAKNAQAQDLMRALALLYREMAEELEDSGLFERRLFPLDFVDLAKNMGLGRRGTAVAGTQPEVPLRPSLRKSRRGATSKRGKPARDRGSS